jgi:hypothetical protein
MGAFRVMVQDLITRNLIDQSNNFGQESIVVNAQGTRQFQDPTTGQLQSRPINASAYDLQNSPLDNSFQVNPESYAIAKSMFSGQTVPENLSNTYGAVAAVTAKSLSTSPLSLFKNGVMSPELLENMNFFRTQGSQIGYNSGSPDPPYLNNLMLNAKILAQTT